MCSSRIRAISNRSVAELKKYKFISSAGVNTLFNALLHTPGFETVDFSALRVNFAAAWPCKEWWRAMENNDGLYSDQGWGLTETSPIATANPTGLDFTGRSPSRSSTDISIRDDAGKELPVNGSEKSVYSDRRSCTDIGIGRMRPRK